MQPLLIGNYDAGVQKNLTPFMIPEKAAPDMLNAFVYRGRIQRKSGYSLLGRLRRAVTGLALGNTDGGGALSVNLLSTFTGVAPNASLQPGSISIAIGAQTFTDPASNGVLTNGGAGTGTVNYSTGAVTIQTNPVLAATAATAAFGYYPNLPVMGIRTEDDTSSVNQERTIFFDTRYAYRFTSTFTELPSTLATTWSGTDSQQFWSTNFQFDSLGAPLFWVTNGVKGFHQYAITSFPAAAAGPPSTLQITAAGNTFQLGDIVFINNALTAGGAAVSANNALFGTVTVTGNPTFTISNPATGYFTAEIGATGNAFSPNRNVSGDGIRYYNGTTWANFNPVLNIPVIINNVTSPGNNLAGALLIVPYKGRLVVLNTIEGTASATSNFPQRARWSQLAQFGQGDGVLDYGQGWRDDIVGRGGFDDAATEEQIISCAFVKDELIVYFERSTWKLVYTGNEVGPFIWQRISSELGADSTFSNVNFDDGLLCFGNVGVHQCNGSIVKRIDEVIPDEVFNTHQGSDGPERVSGIRDFYQEIVYFAYAIAANNTPGSPGKIFFPNKMMIYNYRNNTFSFFDDNATCFGYFQRTGGKTWAELNTFPWISWNIPWNAGVLQSGFPSVNFGNQQGFVETILPFESYNSDSLYVKNITGKTITSPQHNLFTNQYVRFTNLNGITLADDAYQITVVDENTFTINTASTGTYVGGGQIKVLTQLSIPTKQFTPFWTQGKNYNLKYIDVLVDKTSAGELQVDVYVDFNETQSMTDTTTGTILGSSTLSTAPENTQLPYYAFQNQSVRIWKRFYTFATGETFQVKFSFNDTEMRTPAINEANVVIHGMIFFFEPAGEFY